MKAITCLNKDCKKAIDLDNISPGICSVAGFIDSPPTAEPDKDINLMIYAKDKYLSFD
jgi:hypothetical protein